MSNVTAGNEGICDISLIVPVPSKYLPIEVSSEYVDAWSKVVQDSTRAPLHEVVDYLMEYFHTTDRDLVIENLRIVSANRLYHIFISHPTSFKWDVTAPAICGHIANNKFGMAEVCINFMKGYGIYQRPPGWEVFLESAEYYLNIFRDFYIQIGVTSDKPE